MLGTESLATYQGRGSLAAYLGRSSLTSYSGLMGGRYWEGGIGRAVLGGRYWEGGIGRAVLGEPTYAGRVVTGQPVTCVTSTGKASLVVPAAVITPPFSILTLIAI